MTNKAGGSPVPAPLHAFAGYGVELEYMIVDRHQLSVKPVADRLLQRAAAEGYDVERGAFGWSNELVLHVVEIKNLQPSATLTALPVAFQKEVQEIAAMLEPLDARLMPTAMHPWMDPHTETRLWPHHNEAIYRAYARIFDVNSHGWANLQSMHINLPFADDAEFARLHAAIRLVLPILPALAASSPIAGQNPTGHADYRMHVYWSNAARFPEITGDVIPENVGGRIDYENTILAPMYRAIAPLDPEGILRHEWLNSRGAIARFDRNAIEIRVVDMQECPLADLAIAAAASFVVKALYCEGEERLPAQQSISTPRLAAILRSCLRDAEHAVIGDAGYLSLLGLKRPRCTAGELWAFLMERMAAQDPHYALWREPLQLILNEGSLASRILHACGTELSRGRLLEVYRELCDCLEQGRSFLGR